MNPIEFLKTIYLGDRSIIKVIIDGYNKKIALQIDNISRIPAEQSIWDYYEKEDVLNGYLVFHCAKAIKISPIGAIADDYISSIDIVPIEGTPFFFALISVGGSTCQGERCEVKIEIEFNELSIDKTYEYDVPTD